LLARQTGVKHLDAVAAFTRLRKPWFLLSLRTASRTLPRDTARAMSAAETELLRAFREGFEQGNRAWNVGDVKTAYAALPDQLEYRLRLPGPKRGSFGAGTR
jgi:hypothetical protein